MPTTLPQHLQALSEIPSALLLNVAQQIIGDGSSLNGCGTVILHTIGTIDDKTDFTKVTTFHRYILKGLWAFLLTSRTPAEIDKFNEQLTTCRCASLPAPLCNTIDGPLHYFPESLTKPHDLKIVVNMFTGVIDNYMMSFKSSEGRFGKLLGPGLPYRRTQSELRNFARSLSELLPPTSGGVDEAVDALWGWLNLPSESLPNMVYYRGLLACMTYLIHFCRGHISPTIVRRPKLMDDIIGALYSVVETIEENATANAFSRAADFSYSVICFLYALKLSSFDVEFRIFVKEEHTSQLMELSQEFKRLRSLHFLTHGAHAEDTFNFDSQGLFMLARELIRDVTACTTPEPGLYLMNAIADALALDRGGRCAAPECINTHATANYKFQRCRGCGQSAYCSKACQRHAWSHFIIPHKAICSYLVGFKGIVASAMNANPEWDSVDVMHRASIKDLVHDLAPISNQNFTKATLRIATNPDELGTTLAVAAHYKELKRIKMTFLYPNLISQVSTVL